MSTNFSSVSAINGDVLWRGPITDPREIDDVMGRAGDALRRWRATTLDQRIAVVRRYGQYLESHRDQIAALVSDEVGKLSWDASAEVGAAISKIELSIQALEQRRTDTEAEAGMAKRHIRYHPIGVALVLGPFNFPLHLPGGQIIPALLAGNAVVFKPSELATAVGQWMVTAWEEAGLPDDVLQMITGGVQTAVAAIDSPAVSGVFLTGSRAAGRAIHRQLAGRPDVLLALELGGNNPIVVSETADPNTVGGIVSFSAFISSGQRCTCARRAIFIESDSTQPQIDSLVDATRKLSVGMPDSQPTPHVGPLITEEAATGIKETYERLLQLGCKPLIPLEQDSKFPSLVHPAIVDASDLSRVQLGQLGELEWFGPLLVIQRVASLESAIESAADTPYGLAASLLGGSQETFDRFVAQVGAGVVNWNGPTTGAAGALPFGGLGDSGNHRPAGFFAIDFCSDPVASLEYAEPSLSDPWSVAT